MHRIWAYAIGLVALAIIMVCFVLLVHPGWFDAFKLRYHGSAGVWCVNTIGCEESENILIPRLHFWTPKPGATRIGPKVDDNQWEEEVTDEDLDKFNSALEAMPGVEGIRRFEVYGHGTRQVSTYKFGYWYEIGTTSKFDKRAFLQAYQGMCHGCMHVYFERSSVSESLYEKLDSQ